LSSTKDLLVGVSSVVVGPSLVTDTFLSFSVFSSSHRRASHRRLISFFLLSVTLTLTMTLTMTMNDDDDGSFILSVPCVLFHPNTIHFFSHPFNRWDERHEWFTW
jgi:hypothetical protein